MRVGVLFSGGKDSFYAFMKAAKFDTVACFISIVSENPDSFMFHTPGQNLLEAQAKALDIPLVIVKTKGVKESELTDLERAIKEAKRKYRIKGVVTGALASVYQATRVQRICNDLKLWCFNPLWQKDQLVLLPELVDQGIVVGINGVAAEPFDKSWLGRTLTAKVIDELTDLTDTYYINPAGEGGEFETFVIDSPLHKKRLRFGKPILRFENNAGRLDFESVSV